MNSHEIVTLNLSWQEQCLGNQWKSTSALNSFMHLVFGVDVIMECVDSLQMRERWFIYLFNPLNCCHCSHSRDICNIHTYIANIVKRESNFLCLLSTSINMNIDCNQILCLVIGQWLRLVARNFISANRRKKLFTHRSNELEDFPQRLFR